MENKESKWAETLVKSGSPSVFGRLTIRVVGIGVFIYASFFTWMLIDVFILAAKEIHIVSLVGMGIINVIMYLLSAFLLIVNPNN